MGRFFIFLMFIFYCINLYSGEYNSNKNGNWELNTVWVGLEIPPFEESSTNIEINIHDSVYLNNDYEGGNHNIFKIYSGSYLIINGDLIINNHLHIIVEEGGYFVINGNINMNNHGSLEINGDLKADSILGNQHNTIEGVGNIDTDYIDDDIYNPDSLPIELYFFEVEILNDKIQINWTTVSETNNDYFTIYKSLNGLNWELLSHIQGAGNNNNILHYKYVDNNPINGVIYYKLRQTDFDGKYKEFNIISIIYQKSNIKIKNNIIDNPNQEYIEIFNLQGVLLYKGYDSLIDLNYNKIIIIRSSNRTWKIK